MVREHSLSLAQFRAHDVSQPARFDRRRWLWEAVHVLAGITIAGGAGLVRAETSTPRTALLVGNANYAGRPLRNPVNDVNDLASVLRSARFEVIVRTDRTPDALRADLADFQDRLKAGGVGLFYFAGHGVQTHRGVNYLLPTGVDYRRERDVELYGVEVGSVLRRMEESRTELSLVILDACRDSPLPPESRSTASRGLARMEAPSGSMIAFATAPGSVADDNTGQRNGLYTQHLLNALQVPGLRLEDVFKRVRRGVEAATQRRQSPEEISKLTSEEPFYFLPPSTPMGDPLLDWGLRLKPVDTATQQQWKLKGGALVDAVEGAAAKAGLRSGDVLLAIDNVEILSVAQAKQVFDQRQSMRALSVMIRRGEWVNYVVIRKPTS